MPQITQIRYEYPQIAKLQNAARSFAGCIKLLSYYKKRVCRNEN